jgi:hypothetical protein
VIYVVYGVVGRIPESRVQVSGQVWGGEGDVQEECSIPG